MHRKKYSSLIPGCVTDTKFLYKSLGLNFTVHNMSKYNTTSKGLVCQYFILISKNL